MFFYKTAKEYGNRTGKVSDFKSEIQAHKYYKIIEPLFDSLSENNKICFIHQNIYQDGSNSNVKGRSFAFEEITLNTKEREAMKLLGTKEAVWLERPVVIITCKFTFSGDVDPYDIVQSDSLLISIKQYRFIGYRDTSKNTYETGWLKKDRQKEYSIIFNSPDKIMFAAGGKYMKASVLSMGIVRSFVHPAALQYISLFIEGMFNYMNAEYKTYIFKDVLNDTDSFVKCGCPISLSELKDFKTKDDFFRNRYSKTFSNIQIPKRTFNIHSFCQDYYISEFVKEYGGGLLSKLLSDEDNLNMNYFYEICRKKREIVHKMFLHLTYKRYSHHSFNSSIAEDIEKILFVLPASIKKKNLPSGDILRDVKHLKEYHDRLLSVLPDKERKMLGKKTNKEIEKDKAIFDSFTSGLPDGWHAFLQPNSLVHESHIMENCIDTYQWDLAESNSGLYWAEINGRRYNAEVTIDKKKNKMHLRQLFGKKNSEPVKKDVLPFKKYVQNFYFIYQYE